MVDIADKDCILFAVADAVSLVSTGTTTGSHTVLRLNLEATTSCLAALVMKTLVPSSD
jgi:hypothetical protein